MQKAAPALHCWLQSTAPVFHHIMDSDWLVLKGTLKLIVSQPLAIGRDIFH